MCSRFTNRIFKHVRKRRGKRSVTNGNVTGIEEELEREEADSDSDTDSFRTCRGESLLESVDTLASTKNDFHPSLGTTDEFVGGNNSAINEQNGSSFTSMEDKSSERTDESTIVKNNVRSCGRGKLPPDHRLYDEVERVFAESLERSKIDVTHDKKWQLVHSEGESMKVYIGDVTEDGIPCDPVRAFYFTKGLTAYEVSLPCYDPRRRMEWNSSIVEKVRVLEQCAEDTCIWHEIGRRIWPAKKREIVCWSQVRQLPAADYNPEAHSVWMMCTHSTTHPDAPPNDECVRVKTTIAQIFETFLMKDCRKDGAEISREDVSVRISYMSKSNPGGWVPRALMRAAYTREYPRFFKLITNYVRKLIHDKPVLL